jgi:hypothetical protein
VNCVICGIRKARRHCPGVQGDICSICCGTEREQSIDCPLDCPYLRDAHAHEKPPEVDGSRLPNRDIPISEKFLETNQVLLAFFAVTVFEAARLNTAATDWDVREALEALIGTFRALESRLHYEPRPDNVYAAGIVAHIQAKLADIKRREMEASGVSTIRDSAVLAMLTFLQRLEYAHNNGRKRSRAFIDFLGGFYTPAQTSEAEQSEPGPDLNAPRIIL